jgi:mannose-6-phosphate isomerase-like protein (cupin superfamily)
MPGAPGSPDKAGTDDAMHDDHDHDDHDHYHPDDGPSQSVDAGIDEDILATHYHSKKDRVFLRGIVGDYNLGAELKRLRDMPRVRKAREVKFVDGPQAYSRHYIEPKDGITQTFHLHLEEYGPGGKSQKHGHVNEAAFYILDGAGYEIHDNQRYEWEAGDIAIVHNNCVHQHFNASETEPARALVIKTKPMFLFMNMLFQKTVEPRQTQAAPGGAGFRVREEEDDFNHPEEGY